MIIVGSDYHPGFQQIFGPKVFATTMTNTILGIDQGGSGAIRLDARSSLKGKYHGGS